MSIKSWYHENTKKCVATLVCGDLLSCSMLVNVISIQGAQVTALSPHFHEDNRNYCSSITTPYIRKLPYNNRKLTSDLMLIYVSIRPW